jgi:hypothetical protein
MGYVDDILKIVLAELHQTETSDWSMYPGGAPARMYRMFCKCREDKEARLLPMLLKSIGSVWGLDL